MIGVANKRAVVALTRLSALTGIYNRKDLEVQVLNVAITGKSKIVKESNRMNIDKLVNLTKNSVNIHHQMIGEFYFKFLSYPLQDESHIYYKITISFVKICQILVINC